MRRFEIVAAAEPFQHSVTAKTRWLGGTQRLIRRIRILAKITDETMLLWVHVDIAHQVGKILGAGDADSTERSLKQIARAPVRDVDRLGVTVEQVGELLRGVQWLGKTCQVSEDLTGLFVPDTHQQMEMVSQQTIRKRLCNRFNILGVQRQKIRIVARFAKNIFAAVATIVNVIVRAIDEWNLFLHFRFSRPVRS